MSISESQRQTVFERADHLCEYCHTSRRLIGMPHVIDHILPRKLDGTDDLENLCAACYRCNEYKGSRITGYDAVTGQIVSLYNPRTQDWKTHFSWTNGGVYIAGQTPIGRATVIALRLNNEYVVESRQIWVASGWHPPELDL